eukprot:m.132026 g.132026  ORF g.132026 m.132026 type:complete len:863 (+) comp29581_c0_seq1:206-2794(+)
MARRCSAMFFGLTTLFIVAGTAASSTQTPKLHPDDFLNNHQHVTIDVTGDHRDTIEFFIHVPRLNRTVQIKTKPNKGVFTKDFKATHISKDGKRSQIDIDLRRFHVGSVVGETDSAVYIHLREDGLVNGVVHMADEQLHIEPAHRYQVPSDQQPQEQRRSSAGVHLVYSYSDIKASMIEKVGEYCGATTPPTESFYRAAANGAASTVRRSKRDASAQDDVSLSASDCRISSSAQCDCALALVADLSFLATSYAEGSVAIAAQYMVNMAISGDAIYRATSFNGVTGVGLAIASVAVDESETLNQAISNPETLLETFSSSGAWSSYCVAHLFTNRDYSGTLGLAYIGTLCSSSDNAGFHSSYGVPEVVQRLTFVHEIGHNWGANHDTTSSAAECIPGTNYGGNYIMYASATDGSRTNNLLFSPCSTAEMSTALSRVSCFTQTTAHCGNGIVEPGEDCDCGLACSETSCCTTSCTVNTGVGYTCSPQDPISNPCCTPEDGSAGQCQFVSADLSQVCDDEDSCDSESTCSGSSATCPPGTPKPDYVTECACLNDDCDAHPQTGSKVCYGGQCNTSMCVLTYSRQCKNPDKDTACDLSCVGGGWGNGTVCVSSFDTTRRNVKQEYGVHVVSGSTCNNNKGYCTDVGVCLSVGNDLAGQWRERGGAFFTNYWWAFVLVLFVFYLLHFAIRRVYRVKRRTGYETLSGASGNSRFLGGESSRGGFETAQDDISDSDDNDDDVSETTLDSNVRDFYERERRSVILNHYKDKFVSATTEEELNGMAVSLKETVQKGHLDQGTVMELRVAYTTKLNTIRGFESDSSSKFDSLCGYVDGARGATTKVWHTTKTKAKKSMKKFQKEVSNQDYVYY